MNPSDGVTIYNESGILLKRGAAFHVPSDFAINNLFYTIWSNEYVCNQEYSVRRNFLEYYSITQVLEGEMEFEYMGKNFKVSAGNLVLIDLRNPHFYRVTSPQCVKWEILFRGNASAAYYDLITSHYGYVYKNQGRIASIVNRIREELISSFPDDHRISFLIHELLSNIQLQDHPVVPPIIEIALEYINKNYSQSLKIDDIADYVNLSKHYFSRQFQAYTGYSPHDYLIYVRILEANEMLTEKRMSVAEVAEACGFVNTSHFVRVFKEKTGQTPASFRNFFNMLRDNVKK